MITVCDPTHWLKEHQFNVNGQVLSNSLDARRYSGPRVLINRYIDPFDYDSTDYNIVLWVGLENLEVHQKTILPYLYPGNHVFVSDSYIQKLEIICHPGYLYPLASMPDMPKLRPNYQARYLVDVLIGRIDAWHKINRAWVYYEIKKRNLESSAIMPVRQDIDIESMIGTLERMCPDIADNIKNSVSSIGSIKTSSGHCVDSLEDPLVMREFLQGLDPHDIFGSVFEHTAQKNIPLGMYQQSAYSLIMPDWNVPMICEKVSKALIMGRPFVVVGPQNYLANLRNLGFQTFDSVIDESYDGEPNHLIRWSMAMDSLEKLSQQSVQSVYDRLKKRLKHNRKLSYNNVYWINRLKTWLNYKIKKHTGIECAIY